MVCPYAVVIFVICNLIYIMEHATEDAKVDGSTQNS